eukprot:COSAG06_NODE_1513_length_9229_cov_32.533735_6_plen_404_part_00
MALAPLSTHSIISLESRASARRSESTRGARAFTALAPSGFGGARHTPRISAKGVSCRDWGARWGVRNSSRARRSPRRASQREQHELVLLVSGCLENAATTVEGPKGQSAAVAAAGHPRRSGTTNAPAVSRCATWLPLEQHWEPVRPNTLCVLLNLSSCLSTVALTSGRLADGRARRVSTAWRPLEKAGVDRLMLTHGPGLRARWAGALHEQEAARRLPLDERRAIASEEAAAMKARLAATDAGELAARVNEVKQAKADAAALGLKRAAEATRARKALQQAQALRDAEPRSVSPVVRTGASPAPAEPQPPTVGLASADVPERNMPMDGWQCVQAKCGRVYFVNSVTQHAQWTVPLQSAAAHAELCAREPTAAARRWRNAIEAHVLAKRHHRLVARLKAHAMALP